MWNSPELDTDMQVCLVIRNSLPYELLVEVSGAFELLLQHICEVQLLLCSEERSGGGILQRVDTQSDYRYYE